jgi:FdhE protein
MLEARNAQQLLVKKIAACRTRGFLPAELLDLIEKIYTRQLEARDQADVPAAETIVAADALLHSQGAPLVERSRFPFDRGQTVALFDEFLQLLQGSIPALAEAAKVITAAAADGTLDLDAAMQAHLNGDEAWFSGWAAKTPSAPRALPMLVQAAMTPSLERSALMLAQKTDLTRSWPHGHCPLCGSMPIMSDLREKEGFRYHVCGFCHAEYHSPRLQCPFCLEKEAAKLEYYEAKEEPGVRINACKSCKMYIKQTDFRNLDRRGLPLLDDLESLALDVVARDKKYKRPTLSAWGF